MPAPGGRSESGFDPAQPTLVLTECVLVYMDRAPAEALVRALSEALTDACWASYDMITPTDAFGKTMKANLRAAQFHVPGAGWQHVPLCRCCC